MKKLFKKATVWVTALTLALGTAVVPASAATAKKPVIEDVDYNGKGVVDVEFAKNVKYKKPTVTVKDNKGKKYKASITKKDSDDIKFKIKKVKKNRTYTFKIKGVRNAGTTKSYTVAGKVKAPKKNVASKTLIGKAKAKSIAYANAGVAASAVKSVFVQFDYDDGKAIYEVDFRTADAEYEYDIAATTGKIIDKDVEKFRKPAKKETPKPAPANEKPNKTEPVKPTPDNSNKNVPVKPTPDNSNKNVPVKPTPDNSNNSTPTNGTTPPSQDTPVVDNSTPAPAPTPAPKPAPAPTKPTYITKAEAKNIALNNAKLKASQVYFQKVELDREDGRMIYEIEFYKGYMEYEYDIDAVTGKILKKDVEYDD